MIIKIVLTEDLSGGVCCSNSGAMVHSVTKYKVSGFINDEKHSPWFTCHLISQFLTTVSNLSGTTTRSSSGGEN